MRLGQSIRFVCASPARIVNYVYHPGTHSTNVCNSKTQCKLSVQLRHFQNALQYYHVQPRLFIFWCSSGTYPFFVHLTCSHFCAASPHIDVLCNSDPYTYFVQPRHMSIFHCSSVTYSYSVQLQHLFISCANMTRIHIFRVTPAHIYIIGYCVQLQHSFTLLCDACRNS